MNTIIFDLETTGLDVEKVRIVEYMFYNIKTHEYISGFVNPECEIPPEVIKINGITNMDVDDQPVFKEHIEKIMDFIGPKAYLVAHNAIRYDVPLLYNELKRNGQKPLKGWKVIDTLRIARTLYPDLKNHKQDTLREKFKLGLNNNHQANKDVLDLGVIFCNMLKGKKIEELYKMSNEFIYTRMPFGKHRGKLISEVPDDYIKWMLGTDIFYREEDLMRTFIKAGKIEIDKN